MNCKAQKRPFAYLLAFLAISFMIFAASPTALAARVSISSVAKEKGVAGSNSYRK